MSYKEKPIIKLYKYQNGNFIQQAIIDDYQECSFEHNLYQAGTFTITINYNIPNALLFQRGMFIQFGNDPYDFGEILSITDSIGEDGKGSQVRTITGKDARFIFKRRIIKNLNNEENWAMTDKGEICLRELVKAQCGSGAEEKRQLPISNTIPVSSSAIGKEYSVAEAFSNLYDTLVTIATQSEIGWRIKFDGALTLEVFEGSDLSSQVQFSTDFDSLSNGQFTDSAESYANTIYVGGKGTGADRDIYEGESAIEGESPTGLDRYEAWDNQSSMTSESEYEAEAFSMLTQYGQTLNINGQGLAKCPYEFQKQYNIGDTITLAFSGKSAKAQILSVTEHWVWGQYGIEFSFGKPQNDLSRQLQLILKQIQKASNKTTTTSSVKYYTIPTDTSQPKADVIYDTIGFEGDCGNGATFTLYYDSEKTGAKTYHVWFKQLAGSGKLTLTTGVSGASNLVLNSGTYVAIIYVDADGNVLSQGATTTDVIQTGSTQPIESGAVADAIENVTDIASSLPTDAVLHYSFDEVPDYPDGTAISYYNKNFVASDFTATRCTLTVTDGIIKAQNTSSNNSFISNTNWKYGTLTGKILKAKVFIHDVRTDEASSILRLIAYGTLNDVTIEKDKWVEVCYVIGTDSQASTTQSVLLGARFLSESTDNYFMIESLYIGDGSYSTPIIDNANGQNNAVNNGGIAVQGVSGKGLFFVEGAKKKITIPYDFNMNEWTISLWVNLNEGSQATSLNPRIYHFGYIEYCFIDNLYKGYSGNRNATFYTYYDSNEKLKVQVAINPYVNIGKFTHIVVTTILNLNGTSTKKVYINGVLVGSATTTTLAHRPSSTSKWLGGTNDPSQNQYLENSTVDDLLIFDRALSDTEVLALYQNKANTPKYFTKADLQLPQKQDSTLSTPLTIAGQQYTTVESALSALAGAI